MTTKNKTIVSCIIILLFTLLWQTVPTKCEEVKSSAVIILPFTVHAAKDLSFLKHGIRDMLASRLAAGAGVKVIENAAFKESDAGISDEEMRKLGRESKADYLITGSLTALGGGVSLDARVIAISRPAPPATFFSTAEREDDVIQSVDKLAWDIAEKLFGYKRPAPEIQHVQTMPEPALAPFQTAHPERAFLQGNPGAPGGPSPFIRSANLTGTPGFTKSQNLKLAMQTIDVGDVDGDGQEDVVLGAGTQVFVYHLNGSRLDEFWQIPVAARYKIHSVSLADLNHNGRMEIYVGTANKGRPDSFAVEWREKDFGYLFKDAHWFIKAVNRPGEGLVLAGQRAGANGDLISGLYELRIDNGALQEEGKLPVPDFINLFDFAYADLDGDGQDEIVAIDQNDRIEVLRQNGKLLWKSDEHFGGTNRFIGEEKGQATSESNIHATRGRIYIPSRIVVSDLNKDGAEDVIVNKNLSTSSRVFKNLKSYPSGEIHALTWNGIALTDLWRTRKIDGHITDYQLRPGRSGTGSELFVGMVLRSGWLDVLSSDESAVLIYSLKDTQESPQKNSR